MTGEKTKIVLDADVIIHFVESGYFYKLPLIFKDYQYILLDVVYDEIRKNTKTKKYIDTYISGFRNIKEVEFQPKGESMKEYFRLKQTRGDGESACMVYCRYNKNVLASSNLRDIKDYCSEHNITYLTTLDFLYYAYIKKVMTEEECEIFIEKVLKAGSKIKKVKISEYVTPVILF